MKTGSYMVMQNLLYPSVGQNLILRDGEEDLTLTKYLNNELSESQSLWHLGLGERELPTDDSALHWGALDGEFSGAGVRIGIVDDGFDVSHPDLNGRFADSESGLKATIAADRPGATGHGTAVAGVISAQHVTRHGKLPPGRREELPPPRS